MTALHDPATEPSASTIVDFVGFRHARRTVGAPPAEPIAAPAPVPHGENVLAFPIVPRHQPVARNSRRKAGEPAAFDAHEACERLVERFRIMHEAMVELVVACRNAPPDSPGPVSADETSEVMINLATLSMSTERFQEQLGETVAAAFR